MANATCLITTRNWLSRASKYSAARLLAFSMAKSSPPLILKAPGYEITSCSQCTILYLAIDSSIDVLMPPRPSNQMMESIVSNRTMLKPSKNG